jgi:hypothetical protein
MPRFLSSPDLARLAALPVLLAVTAGFAGCQKASSVPPNGRDGVVPTYNSDTGRLERISYDRNKDGKADAWLFMDGTRAVRAELDENHDGAADRWEYYRNGGQSAGGGFPRGELERAEQSSRFDGIVSRWETYEAGTLKAVREDTSGDGQPDKWEVWAGGALAEVALDTKGSGKADRKIVYPADGSSPQMLVDAGDGIFKPLDPAP